MTGRGAWGRACGARGLRVRRGVWRPVVLAAMLVGCPARALLAQATGTRAAFPVQAGVQVQPDTVRVGDPFIVTVGVRAPAGATIAFPDAPDSSGTVQALDPVRVETRPDSTAVEQWATYRVAAWDVGAQPIVLGEVVVHLGAAERRIPLGDHGVFVRSVLPADTTLRVPKPPRPLYIFSAYPWWIWLVAAAVALLLLALWWWLRRRRRPRAPVLVDPFEQAEREFARIEALGLLEAGERGRYVALMVEVLRDYLAARYAAAHLSRTSTELLAAVRGERAIGYDRLAHVLGEADLVKFARRPLTVERARELGREARGVVAAEHAASAPAPQEQAA